MLWAKSLPIHSAPFTPTPIPAAVAKQTKTRIYPVQNRYNTDSNLPLSGYLLKVPEGGSSKPLAFFSPSPLSHPSTSYSSTFSTSLNPPSFVIPIPRLLISTVDSWHLGALKEIEIKRQGKEWRMRKESSMEEPRRECWRQAQVSYVKKHGQVKIEANAEGLHSFVVPFGREKDGTVFGKNEGILDISLLYDLLHI